METNEHRRTGFGIDRPKRLADGPMPGNPVQRCKGYKSTLRNKRYKHAPIGVQRPAQLERGEYVSLYVPRSIREYEKQGVYLGLIAECDTLVYKVNKAFHDASMSDKESVLDLDKLERDAYKHMNEKRVEHDIADNAKSLEKDIKRGIYAIPVHQFQKVMKNTYHSTRNQTLLRHGKRCHTGSACHAVVYCTVDDIIERLNMPMNKDITKGNDPFYAFQKVYLKALHSNAQVTAFRFAGILYCIILDSRMLQ
jgi:hypothetical protein